MMNDYLLALDTSSRALTVALLRDNELLAEDGMEAERNHSIFLLPVVQRMLAEHGVSVNQLRAVAVGKGPGSYTGVRIGVTVAKTMAWALKVPLLGVSSCEAFSHAARFAVSGAAGVDGSEVHFVPLLDARRSQIFTAQFVDRAGVWQRLADDRIAPAADWLEQAAGEVLATDNRVLVLHGDLDSFADPIERVRMKLGDRLHLAEVQLSAYHVGLLARLRLLNGEVDDLHAFVPNYAQLAEAEAKLLAAKALEGTGNGEISN